MYRDKEGKAVSREELEAARKAELDKKAKERETPEWAAGLRQQREAADRRAAMTAEAAKPFARSKCGSSTPADTPEQCNRPAFPVYSVSNIRTIHSPEFEKTWM